nr:uncharacterized protein LOC127315299 [Lolium perenne]
MLTFSGEEMDTVLASMKTDTAPGPDGFPVFFFKEFWQLAKPLILAIANGFALGRVDIARLNMGVLSLIPKVPVANDIRQFRPIALINVIFKFVAKAYAIRLSPIAHRTISLTQSAFIRGHHIHEGILALQEIIHETKSKKLQGVFLKLDFEKAYDRVNWAFLREVLLRKGFEPGGFTERLVLVSGAGTAIGVNGEVGNFFRNGRGDADDTIIMLQPDDLAIANLKYILLCFENMSGLRINFHKSEVMVLGGDETEGTRIANMLNCKRGTFPFTYLGLPVSDRALLASDWGPLTNKVAKRADPWMGKLMSSAARLTLINACLSSLPLHAMAVCLLGEGVHGLFDKARSRFYWEANGAKRIVDTRLMNICLMAKWIWRSYAGEQGLWAKILRAKYLGERDLLADKHRPGSQFWNAIQKIKHVFGMGARHAIHNGRATRFWVDWWHEKGPLKDLFPGLFAIASEPLATVATLFRVTERRLTFRRELGFGERVELANVARLVETIHLSDPQDRISWSLEPNGKFSVRSLLGSFWLEEETVKRWSWASGWRCWAVGGGAKRAAGGAACEAKRAADGRGRRGGRPAGRQRVARGDGSSKD